MGTWRMSILANWYLMKVGKEMSKRWNLRGHMGLTKVRKEKVLLEFENREEAVVRVPQKGGKFFSLFHLELQWWIEVEGCEKSMSSPSKLWVRLVGLLIHLCTRRNLDKLGEACKGFPDVDEGTRT